MSGGPREAMSEDLRRTSLFSAFEATAAKLEETASRALRGEAQITKDRLKAHQRQIFASFRELVDLQVRRTAGAFFTGNELSTRVTRAARPSAVVLDPACGIGDLLLSHSFRLRPAQRLDDTLDQWGELLLGLELEEPLIRVARARLALAAVAHHQGQTGEGGRTRRPLELLFPGLKQGDGLDAGETVGRATDILLNPPYCRIQAPADCEWGAGSVTAAAVFVDRCLSYAVPRSRITAILPDVLRSGSRYAAWRARVEAYASIDGIEIAGRFDSHTNIDVFVLRLTVRESRSENSPGLPWVAQSTGLILGDYFRVSVGPLVAYRAPLKGSWHPYLDVSRATPWAEIRDPRPFRRFAGRVVQPPFVAIRRTSSPHDRQRAVATLVTGERPVAVENHLLVMEPYDGSEDTCRLALSLLASEKTTEWLNGRIRCRHLTVDSVREIPFG